MPKAIPIPATSPAAEPSLADLGRQIRALTMRHERFDCSALRSSEDGEPEARMMEALTAQAVGIEAEIVSRPAETLEDAAVQAAVCFAHADILHGCTMPEKVADEYVAGIRRAQISIMRVIARHTALDINSIGWNDHKVAIAREFSAAEA